MAHKFGIFVFSVGVLALSAPLFAHHGTASFETGVTKTVAGKVTEYVWTNPHVLVKVDVTDASGTVQHWVVEAWNPVTQASRGWTKDTFKMGDDVAIDVTPAKNDRPVGNIRGKIVINGKEFKQAGGPGGGV